MQSLGFSQYEAKVYVALLQRNPATAYEVSKEAGLPHANVYRTLEGLQRKAIVQPVSQRPARYVPVKPRQVLQNISKRTAAACDALAKNLSTLERGDDIEHVWLISGQENTHEKIEEMINGTKEHLWIKSHEATLDLHLPSLKKAAKRGVQILIIFIGDPLTAKRYKFNNMTKVYCHEGTGRSGIGEGKDTLTITSDFLAALTVDTREGGYGAFTRSAPVVNLANTMIRHELYVAEIFQAFGPQIESKFGPALLNIRRHYLPALHVHALEEQLRLTKSKTP